MLSHKKYTAREELCTTKKLQHWQMRPFWVPLDCRTAADYSTEENTSIDVKISRSGIQLALVPKILPTYILE